MAVGSVDIIKVDGNQGDFSAVERVLLFLGRLADHAMDGEIIPVGAESDLDQVLGAGASELKTMISAARANAKSNNFACYAIGIGVADDWKEVLYAALDHPADLNVEAVVLCTPVTSKTEVQACATAANECLVRFAKYISIIAAVSGVDAATETWGAYITRLTALQDGVAADRVMLVPQLHGNNLGVIAGRLCDPAVSIADSPMRVATGALIDLGEAPVDKNSAPLIMATLAALSNLRFCVPQWYAGYDGVYWADMMTLAAETSDYQEYENLRVIDYCARRVRILAIARIANRLLNNTTASIEIHKSYFMGPLREAARTITVNHVELPAMIKPPAADDITITWTSRKSVAIAISGQPYNSPKKITVYLGLDLSGE